MLRIKRVYDPPAPDDGLRFLVEAWLKDSAPSDALRKWFHQDASRWDEFCQRYFAELDAHPEAWSPLLEATRKGNVTLLFAARDLEHNNAAALKMYLEKYLKRK